MFARDLTVVDGEVAGAWIKPSLGTQRNSVTRQLPADYAAYVRIFHPVCDQDGHPVTWGEVATRLGTVPHPEMQWHAIVGSTDPHDFTGSRWSGSDPLTGELELPVLDTLCATLSAHTQDPDQVFFGLSTITRWEADFAPEELHGKTLLQLPGREYIVLSGRLVDIEQIARARSTPGSGPMISVPVSRREDAAPAIEPTMTRRDREAPNLIWPADRSWFMLSEVDFDSTIVGGSAALIDAIVATPGLEAWAIASTVSLTYDADKINLAPPVG